MESTLREVSMTIYYDHFETPLGLMEICAGEQAVKSIHFVDRANVPQSNSITDLAKCQMLEYFAGGLEEFDLPMEPEGTIFQKQVWRALSTIEYGETCSYSDIANIVKNPKAVRAVGSANGKNPLTIVVPCHRIIGTNGSLTGYASGLERKAWLLNHEANTLF
ncbi:MAG: methylated-DNA-[protein]-cysteine S-methyltransferase [Cryomorphaceae bacterium]|jgi:methylated-DNA-[protein]-cysteine S-methyltransferase